MRLSRPFFRLGVAFDHERMRLEVESFPADAWARHPMAIPGNSALRLISVGGAENDEVDGRMASTKHLESAPYLRQVLSSFGVVWGRTRLMRLAAGASVTPHADINHHWFSRVRLHIPILTLPEVRFYCGDESVHMGPGEAWLFDNWRRHRVVNPTSFERIHLVADTSGGSSFWQFVARSQLSGVSDVIHRFDPDSDATPLTEQTLRRPIMPPAEVDLLILDLRAELGSLKGDSRQDELQMYHALLDNFCKDWRQIYLLRGEDISGRLDFIKLRDNMREASARLAGDIVMKSNGVNAHSVLEARVLRPMIGRMQSLDRPIFIVAAPRSGSTLLFETLAVSSGLNTLGGEAHWLVENVSGLHVGSKNVNSNRLDSSFASDSVLEQILVTIADKLIDASGNRMALGPGIRFLEKTPKNALRIPFFCSLFPDAQFIFLWREPCGNISSIIDAWQSGNFKTYNGLEGFDGPWSLVLPPDWKSMNGRPIEEIAAFQWNSVNKSIVDDLNALPTSRWTVLEYDELTSQPTQAIEQLCAFMGIEVDESLRQRLSSALPLSRYTQTAPMRTKWHRNFEAVTRVLPSVDGTWRQLRELYAASKR